MKINLKGMLIDSVSMRLGSPQVLRSKRVNQDDFENISRGFKRMTVVELESLNKIVIQRTK